MQLGYFMELKPLVSTEQSSASVAEVYPEHVARQPILGGLLACGGSSQHMEEAWRSQHCSNRYWLTQALP